MNALLFAYGNYDRQDDGVSWHIIRKVAAKFSFDLPPLPDEITGEIVPGLTWHFDLQLTPNDAEYISNFEHVLFIDAHTGAIPQDVSWTEVKPEFQTSPMTHHFTPQSCMSLVQVLYKQQPHAILVSVRGYEFEFLQVLSPQCSINADLAVERIYQYIQSIR